MKDALEQVTTTEYDLLSNVTHVSGATMGADQHGYVYDPIGNRTSYTRNQAVTTYTAASQYEFQSSIMFL